MKIVASTFMPGRSRTPGGMLSKTILTGILCVTAFALYYRYYFRI